MRILIDMDGVITDFDGEFLQRWKVRHPNELFIPSEKRIKFYIKDDYPDQLKPLVDEILFESSFFEEMTMVPGAKEALDEMDARGFEVFICTSPLSTYDKCVLEKYKWVENFLGSAWVKKIILTKDKTIIKADFLIDDKPEITGTEKEPSWEHVLYDRPYNRGINKRRITWANWKDILLFSPRV